MILEIVLSCLSSFPVHGKSLSATRFMGALNSMKNMPLRRARISTRRYCLPQLDAWRLAHIAEADRYIERKVAGSVREACGGTAFGNTGDVRRADSVPKALAQPSVHRASLKRENGKQTVSGLLSV